jgi:hypothetical protein
MLKLIGLSHFLQFAPAPLTDLYYRYRDHTSVSYIYCTPDARCSSVTASGATLAMLSKICTWTAKNAHPTSLLSPGQACFAHSGWYHDVALNRDSVPASIHSSPQTPFIAGPLPKKPHNEKNIDHRTIIFKQYLESLKELRSNYRPNENLICIH